MRFPMVVKPVYGSSSAYVVRVDDAHELLETVAYLRQNISADVESALSVSSEILAEEYIDGNEVDIDMLLQNGKIKFWSMSDNDATREPYFVETGQCIPTRLSRSQQLELVDMAEEMLERLGRRGRLHPLRGQIRLARPHAHRNQPAYGGRRGLRFVKTAWGFDLIENAARVMLGQYVWPVIKPDTPKKFLSGKYFLPPHSGVLASLSLPETVKDGELKFFKEVGDAVLAPPLGYEYLGWVFAAADTLGEAEERVERTMEAVNIEIAKSSRGSSLGRTVRRSSMSAAKMQRRAVLGAARIEHIRTLPLERQRDLHVGIATTDSPAATIRSRRSSPRTPRRSRPRSPNAVTARPSWISTSPSSRAAHPGRRRRHRVQSLRAHQPHGAVGAARRLAARHPADPPTWASTPSR